MKTHEKYVTSTLILGALLLTAASAQLLPIPALASSDQEEALHDLFAQNVAHLPNPARHTFVFWINGDADHFVTATASATGQDGGVTPKVYRSDKFDKERIEQIAHSCVACNVVILHDQRGSAHWYTANKPWATYLRVYSRGQKLAERQVNEVDGTDPKLLSSLLQFAQASFPSSILHLVYRGHSFREPYWAGNGRTLPFDYSDPQYAYSEETFLRAIREAHLSRKLGSVTLASCSQSSLVLASRLAQLADYYVASEVDVLETLDVGFRFDSLLTVADWMNSRWVSYQLASRLLSAFTTTPEVEDAMLEYPVTWVDLSGVSLLAGRWNPIARAINRLPEAQRDELHRVSGTSAALEKTVSERYVRALQSQGKSAAIIRMLSEQLRIRAESPDDRDLGLLLETFRANPATGDISNWIDKLQSAIRSCVFVLGPSPESPKAGLSISFGAPSKGNVLPILYPESEDSFFQIF